MMNYNPSDLCYLCGESLGNREVNEDHVVQKQFIRRNQPKAKGFHYAGILFTHEDCNNKFGRDPESMCQKALQLLNVFYSDKALFREHKDNPDIKVILIRNDALSSFTKKDKEYFGFMDANEEFFRNPTVFLANKRKINIFEKPINIALSVLTKSSAAFIIKYENIPLSSKWQILAIPYHIPNSELNLDEILGRVKPLEIGYIFRVKKFLNGDRFTAHQINKFCVFFCFALTQDISNFKIMRKNLAVENSYYFESDKLIDLVGYNWVDNNFKNQN